MMINTGSNTVTIDDEERHITELSPNQLSVAWDRLKLEMAELYCINTSANRGLSGFIIRLLGIKLPVRNKPWIGVTKQNDDIIFKGDYKKIDIEDIASLDHQQLCAVWEKMKQEINELYEINKPFNKDWRRFILMALRIHLPTAPDRWIGLRSVNMHLEDSREQLNSIR